MVYVSGGEGMTSEGEFFEALNAACLRACPVLFLVEDNGYAISVPVEAQTAGGSISKLVRDFPGLHIEECDGTDPLESYDVLRRAADHCRARKGPALVHAHVTRPYSHSLSDDEKLYKPPEEREEEARRDPLPKFALFLVREGILDEAEIGALEAEVDREVLEATDRALAAELPGRRIHFTWTFIRRMSIPPPRSLSQQPQWPATRRPWSRWFPPRWWTRWRATRASWCSAKTWPIAAAKRIWRW